MSLPFKRIFVLEQFKPPLYFITHCVCNNLFSSGPAMRVYNMDSYLNLSRWSCKNLDQMPSRGYNSGANTKAHSQSSKLCFSQHCFHSHVKMTKTVRSSRLTAVSHLGGTRATAGGIRISAGT